MTRSTLAMVMVSLAVACATQTPDHPHPAVGADTSPDVFRVARPARGGTTQTPGTNAMAGCGDRLWQHVYNPSRLLVYAECVTVTGTIVDATAGRSRDGLRHEADGDTHGWLQLDPPYLAMLNAGNVNAEGGNLVFEVVCEYAVKQADAIKSCIHRVDHAVVIPPPGTHVSMTGSYVMDTNHSRWNELHPVSSITPLTR